MSGPRFDDDQDYWVDNPDEFECLICGMQSDDWHEYEAHSASQHFRFVRRPVIAGVDAA